MTRKKLYIDGKWIETKEYYKLRSPYNGQEIAEIPLADEKLVDEAIAAAERHKAVMRSLPAHERSAILTRVANYLEAHMEEAARILAQENAKPLKAARAEITRTIQTYRFSAEEAKRLYGETIPMDAAKGAEQKLGFTVREPLGVIAAITPFNFPFNLVAHKLGPAFAAGNTVVLKPASQTPLSALYIVEVFEKAGLPPGALNIVTGRGGVIGDRMVQDPRVKMVTFTGSLEVGLRIRQLAGLKRVTLELGSNSPVIIDNIRNLDAAVEKCVTGAFAYAGQVCISVQRIYVHEAVYDEFLQKFIARAKALKIGDPLDEDTDISALISSGEVDRIEAWIKEATEQGARVAAGGERIGEGILAPTILTDVPSHVSLCTMEAFAPIVMVNRVKSVDEAIRAANDSQYGLQAGIFTDSIRTAIKAARELESGGIIVNDVPTFRVDHMPYGGVKNSGIGKEGVKYSVEEMTELKFVSFAALE